MKRPLLIPILAALALGLIVVASQLRPPGGAGDYDVAAFGRLPVTAEGRVKPFDTVARNTLFAISGRQTARVEADFPAKGGGTERRLGTIAAVHWLLDAIARPEVADDYAVFCVDHPDVKA